VLDPDSSYSDSGDPCDLDQDGFRATGACGGNDCCDYDSRSNPSETTFYATPDACGSFDYNCDNQLEEQFPTASNCQVSGFTCSGEGFDKTVPACGASGTFDSCNYFVVTCSTSQAPRDQPCR
jgi:hypothetical protein